jgi:hypothetical protein
MGGLHPWSWAGGGRNYKWCVIEFPFAKDFSELVNCYELRIDGVVCGLFDSCGEKIDGVQYSVFVGNGGGSKVVVTELNCVRDD